MVQEEQIKNIGDGFDAQRYELLQKEEILSRMSTVDRLYLEIGGKLSYDSHASRVLPGFPPGIKLKTLKSLPLKWSLIYCVGSPDVEKGSIRNDTDTTYGDFAISEISDLLRNNIPVVGVAITRVVQGSRNNRLVSEMENLELPIYTYQTVDEYPDCSSDDLNILPKIHVHTPLVIVAGVASFCGKMAVCISQIRQEKDNVRVGYAKWETFPVHDLSLQHPINIALDAAVAHEDDPPAIDRYYFQETGKESSSYERELRNFSLLRKILTSRGATTLPSPTSASINNIKKCIIDEDIITAACKQEIIRRYFKFKQSETDSARQHNAAIFVEELMKKTNISLRDRICYSTAHDLSEISGADSSAIQTASGRIFQGVETKIFTPEATLFLEALRETMSNCEDYLAIERKLLDVYGLKRSLNENWNSQVTLAEASIALLETEKSRIHQILKSFKNGNMHSTRKPRPDDITLLRRLGIHITYDTPPQKLSEYF